MVVEEEAGSEEGYEKPGEGRHGQNARLLEQEQEVE